MRAAVTKPTDTALAFIKVAGGRFNVLNWMHTQNG
jgi:hypothetical protein